MFDYDALSNRANAGLTNFANSISGDFQRRGIFGSSQLDQQLGELQNIREYYQALLKKLQGMGQGQGQGQPDPFAQLNRDRDLYLMQQSMLGAGSDDSIAQRRREQEGLESRDGWAQADKAAAPWNQPRPTSPAISFDEMNNQELQRRRDAMAGGADYLKQQQDTQKLYRLLYPWQKNPWAK